MKNLISRSAIYVLIIAAVSFLAFTPQQNGKGKGQAQHGNQGKGNNGNQGKGNNGKGNQSNDHGNGAKSNGNGHENGNGNNGKHENGNDDNNGKGKGVDRRIVEDGHAEVKEKDNNGNGPKWNNKGKKIDMPYYGYTWTRDNFRDRSKIWSSKKVTICHHFYGNNNPVTISVSSNALKAHMAHGDVMGACPVNNSRYSRRYEERRNNYYENLYYGQDRVVYSQSILEYALQRLADSRNQLATYRNSGMPYEELQRKELAVNELQQNVSVLQTLVTLAATYLVDRFM